MDHSMNTHNTLQLCAILQLYSSHARLACITHAEHESALSMVSRVQRKCDSLLRGKYKALQLTSASREPHNALVSVHISHASIYLNDV